MDIEKISQEDFRIMKEKAINNPIEETGEYGSYNSYYISIMDGREVVRVNEWMNRVDGFPYDTRYYACD